MLQYTALIINKGVDPVYILEVFVAIIPTFLEIAIPMAALLGVMLAFARMSGDTEIIVMRASGISLLQLLKPVIIMAIIFSAASFYISIVLRPWGNYKLAQSLFEVAQSKSTAGLHPGVFNLLGKITLYAEGINDQNGDLNRVLIDDRREPDSRKVILAQKGNIISDPESRTIGLLLSDGYIHEIVGKNYGLTHFTSNSLIIDYNEINESAGGAKDKRSREMSLAEIESEIEEHWRIFDEYKAANGDPDLMSAETKLFLEEEHVRNSGDLKRKIRRFKTESGRRFSMPMATFILALLGLPLGIVPPRVQKTWGIGLSVGVGLIVFMVYYMLLSLGITLGENGKINVYIGLWLPNIVASIITFYIIHRVTSEKWNSIAHGFEMALERFRAGRNSP